MPGDAKQDVEAARAAAEGEDCNMHIRCGRYLVGKLWNGNTTLQQLIRVIRLLA
jgi:hypothetical protein